MAKAALTEASVIDKTAVSPEKYRAFFRNTIEGFAPEICCGEFHNWLGLHEGKTLGEAIKSYHQLAAKKSMRERLAEDRFGNISENNKAFITAFSAQIEELGYDFGGTIGSGFCWGPYMIVYSKIGVKSKQVAARIYVRKDSIILRMYFSNIDKHSVLIENAPAHIKDVFTNGHGKCKNCEHGHRKDGLCKFRKTYTIDGQLYEKCNGVVFEFQQPDMEKLPDYMALLREFYAKKHTR